jgi:hypothetical protein
MSESNTAVDEEDGKTGQRQEPREDISTALCQVHKSQASKKKLQKDDTERATLLVNIREELGTHAWKKLALFG